MICASAERLHVERKKPFIERDTFSNVNQIGYVTIEQQVNSLLIAGERLLSYKRKLYDFPDGEVDEQNVRPDPTLDVGFDLADYSFYESQLAKRISKARADAKVEKGVQEGKETSVPSGQSDVAFYAT